MVHFLPLNLMTRLRLQGDVLYSQQGAEFDLDKVDLDYVNVPIVFKYYLVKRLNLHVGPQFGFLVSDFDASEFEDSYKSTDVSGVVGLGLDLPLGFRVDGRYNFGLTEFLPDVKNNVFSLSVGWTLL